MRIALACLLPLLVPVCAMAQAVNGPTLTAVRLRNVLNCSASGATPGFGLFDSQGVLRGLDADTCRAVATAVLGDPSKVHFEVLNSGQRLTALATGQIDVTVQTLTWSQTREAANGLEFAGVNFYDGQSFLVHKSAIKSATDLNGASICVTAGSTSELNLADWARHNHIDYHPVVFDTGEQARLAYDSGRCDSYSTDSSQLAASRTILHDPAASIVLGERISKEPLGPAVRKGDDQWLDIVKWTLFAMIDAEELGVTQANVDDMQKSDVPAVRRLLGLEGDHGKLMGLDNKWAYNVIKALGNYGEMYDRNFGPKTAINLPRKINELWNNGGIMYAPPIR
jgi:general L-amino acid transport system substrate-binding protein